MAYHRTREPGLIDSAVVSAPFSAGGVAGCDLWLDASNEGSITEGGGYVTAWADLSPSGYIAQESSGNMPLTGTRTVNGLNVFEFLGNQWLLLNAPLSFEGSGSGRSLVIVAYKDPVYNQRMMMGKAGVGTTYFGLDVSDSGGYAVLSVNGTSVQNFGGGYSLPTSEMGIIHVWQNSTHIGIGINGTAENSKATTGFVSWDYIGRYNTAGSYAFDGVIGEIVSYDHVLNSGELNTVINGLASKWGITL